MGATRDAAKERNEAGDHKVHVIDTTAWVAREDTNNSIHPSKEGAPENRHSLSTDSRTSTLRLVAAVSLQPWNRRQKGTEKL
jgi:hypothetical protein